MKIKLVLFIYLNPTYYFSLSIINFISYNYETKDLNGIFFKVKLKILFKNKKNWEKFFLKRKWKDFTGEKTSTGVVLM